MEKIGLKEKQLVWDRYVTAVDRAVDGLGTPIDDGIKEALIALKVNGFGTLASCEGHIDRGLPYPWVAIGSQLAEENSYTKSRFAALKKVALVERRGGEKMSDSDRSEFQELLETEMAANYESYIQLQTILSDFFEFEAIDNPTLVIEKGPRNIGRLRPANVIEGNLQQLKEKLAKMSPEDVENALDHYRSDMENFARFLKRQFFT